MAVSLYKLYIHTLFILFFFTTPQQKMTAPENIKSGLLPYSNPLSTNDVYSVSDTMTWSKSFMPIISDASFKRRVIEMSSLEGIVSPLRVIMQNRDGRTTYHQVRFWKSPSDVVTKHGNFPVGFWFTLIWVLILQKFPEYDQWRLFAFLDDSILLVACL